MRIDRVLGHRLLLVAVLVLGLALRLSGLGWGLPDGTLPAHRSSNRGDENAILEDTLAVLQTLRGSPEGLGQHEFYVQEGWVGSYARLAALGFAFAVGYIQFDTFSDREIGGYDLINFRRILLTSRLVTVLAAVATVWLIYIVGSRLWGRRYGLVAALLVAVCPGHVVLSHFAKSNALAGLLSLSSLYFALDWYQQPSKRSAALAGVSAGLAGGARANAVLSGSAIALAVLLRWRTTPRRIALTSIALAAGGAIAALGAGYPHLIADPRVPDYGVGTFWLPGARWRVFGQAFWQFVGGWPGISLLIVGAVLGTVRAWSVRDSPFFITLGSALLYCTFILKTAVPQPRYFVPVAPSLAILVSTGLMWSLGASKHRWLALTAGAVAVVLAFAQLAFAIAYVRVFTGEDTKITTGRWIALNAPPGAVIGKPAWEGDHRVPIDARIHEIVYSQPHADRPELLVFDGNVHLPPDFIIVPEEHASGNQFDLRGYGLVFEVEQPLVALGLRFDDRFPPDDSGAPRWNSQFHSTVRVYRRPASGQGD